MLREQRRIENYLGKLQLLGKISSKIEGIYTTKFDGKNHIMTVFRATASELNVVIATDYTTWSMVEPSWDRKRGQIIVDRINEDDEAIPGPPSVINYQIRIISYNGSNLKAEFTNGISTYKIHATKTKNFVDFSQISAYGGNLKRPTGTWTGTTNNGQFGDMQLIVTHRGPEISGTVSFGDPQFGIAKVPFTNGYFDVKRKVLYLTSEETNSGTVIHVRGKIRGNRMTGIYLVGGKLTPVEFNLRLK